MKDKKAPKVFISYSWEGEKHSDWVKKFADKLLEDGVEVILDQYDVAPGDRLPQFMETSITSSDFVLIICTEEYKKRADKREKGVGYESHVISAELYNNHNERKFIPIIRQGTIKNAMPDYLSGKYAIDLRVIDFNCKNYKDLLTTIYNIKNKPQKGIRPSYLDDYDSKQKAFENNFEYEDIKILGIIANEVTDPKNDGTPGSALYSIPFKLSKTPSSTWKKLFINNWNCPPSFTTMHRPGIATVYSDRIVLNGTTIDEVRDVHRQTLIICVKKTNEEEKLIIKKENELKRIEEEETKKHYKYIEEVSSEIDFDF